MTSTYLFATFCCDVVEGLLSFFFCAVVYLRVAALRSRIVKLRSELFESSDLTRAMKLHETVNKTIRATSRSLENWFTWVLFSTITVILLSIINQSLALVDHKQEFSKIWEGRQGQLANFDDYAMVLIPLLVYSTMERWWLRQIARPLNLTSTDDLPAGSVFKDRSKTELFLTYHDRSLYRRTLRIYDYQVVFKMTALVALASFGAIGLRFFASHKSVITSVLHS